MTTKMDPKATWPVVRFLISATGLRRREARAMLDAIPHEKYSRLFMEALAWERDTDGAASKAVRDLLGDDTIPILQVATERARRPSTAAEDDEDEQEEAPRARKSTRKHL